MENIFEKIKLEPVQDRRDGIDYWNTYNLYTENEVLKLIEQLRLNGVTGSLTVDTSQFKEGAELYIGEDGNLTDIQDNTDLLNDNITIVDDPKDD